VRLRLLRPSAVTGAEQGVAATTVRQHYVRFASEAMLSLSFVSILGHAQALPVAQKIT
jgi:hypothetical protein